MTNHEFEYFIKWRHLTLSSIEYKTLALITHKRMAQPKSEFSKLNRTWVILSWQSTTSKHYHFNKAKFCQLSYYYISRYVCIRLTYLSAISLEILKEHYWYWLWRKPYTRILSDIWSLKMEIIIFNYRHYSFIWLKVVNWNMVIGNYQWVYDFSYSDISSLKNYCLH